jgi:hypothetical protein
MKSKIDLRPLTKTLTKLKRGFAVNKNYPLTDREVHTILASLRYWQIDRQAESRHNACLDDIATKGDKIDALTNDEIDTLCEELNCG